jgi:hypothetical protein
MRRVPRLIAKQAPLRSRFGHASLPEHALRTRPAGATWQNSSVGTL